MSNSSTQVTGPEDCECHDVRNITVDAPEGLIPNVFATPRCSAADFGQDRCPIDSQIGYVVVGIGRRQPEQHQLPGPRPVYNLVPHPGQAGLIGFIEPLLNSAPIFTDIEGRTESDYGLEFTVSNINHVFSGVSVIEEMFWGVPADPANDPFRFKPVGCTIYGVNGAPECEGGAKSNAPLKPFINAPTICGVDLHTEALVESYDHGFDRATGSFPGTTGCDQLSFNPSLFAQPTTKRDRHRLGTRHRPQGAGRGKPDRAVTVGDQRRGRHPAEGLLDQLERRRRQDLLLCRAGEDRAQARGRPMP